MMAAKKHKKRESGGNSMSVQRSMSLVRPQAVRPAVRPARALLTELREMIAGARAGVARAVDSGLVVLYWNVGRRIRRDILKDKRAGYGQRIVSALGRQLAADFGSGFDEKSLRHMIRFAEAFPDQSIVSALRRQSMWTHFKRLIYLDDPLKRDFYAEMCRIERWNTRTLEKKINSMLFERTALSKKPDKLIRRELAALRAEDRLTPDLVFRDPYVLDFLRLHDTYAEQDIEAAILREMESFILELGAGFCFVARQKRMQIDDQDYHLDLLFYHRKMRRLVAIDLKLRNFEAADKGQMELYLNWLKRYECEPGEAPPLGIILCAGKRAQHVELLELEKSGIHVASYWTKVLPKKLLEKKLHDAVRLARARLEPGKG
jgi:predicted nuclease of restriction endonuclease-like (RecB) superfamily